MHPAYSVIFFTTASGAGYGLLFWLSLSQVFGVMPGGRWLSFAMIFVALVLITAGLLSSTFHLGRPERAIGAFSQWRSSWLSREGVAAVATYVPAGLMALLWLLGIETGLMAVLALLSAFGAIVTVYCTGMIYGSLKTIRQWHHPIVPAIYLGWAAATGGILYGFLASFAGPLANWASTSALFALGVGTALKLSYWQAVDADPGKYTREMALGLSDLGPARPLDPPHTRPNFVMREMGYSVARKHAEKLRRVVLLCLTAVPALMLVLALFTGWSLVPLLLALVTASVGVAVERWLFFAEAEHVSQLFYGAARA